MAEIMAEIAREHGVSIWMLKADLRARWIARARQDYMWRCRQVRRADGSARYSFPQIARSIRAEMHHTSVMHGERAHASRLEAAR